jgi:sterol desaturase/sphingolipid hydroxylase (fatty acid hydroxylase superfamily)
VLGGAECKLSKIDIIFDTFCVIGKREKSKRKREKRKKKRNTNTNKIVDGLEMVKND